MDYPIVFVPGLFGSIGDEIIKGTGEFSFGFAEKIYRPFIHILNGMGYIDGKNLFIAYYDWKLTILESTRRYLLPTIEKAKRVNGTDKVIIISHSLGGLLSRTYVEYFSMKDIEKLIMIGTPNLGAVNAYYFWSGGEIPYPKVEENILYKGLKIGFTLYFMLFHKLSYLHMLREKFPVGKDLLPSFDYGDYLFHQKDEIQKRVSIRTMKIQNSFLNRLGTKGLANIDTYIIGGKGNYTNNCFLVEGKEKNKWLDGKPTMAYKTNYGDGTVPLRSTLGFIKGERIVVEGDHIDILYKSKDYLSSILGKEEVKDMTIEEIEDIYIIFTFNCDEVVIETESFTTLCNERLDIEDNRIKALKLSSGSYWITIYGEKDFNININKKSVEHHSSKAFVVSINNHMGIKVLNMPLNYIG